MAQDLSQLLTGSQYKPARIEREHRSGFKVAILPSFLGGINDSIPADLIADDEMVNVENLSFVRGRLSADTGYIQFADALNEVPKGVFEHRNAAGAAVILCVTDKTVYKYNPTYGQWQVIKGLTSTTLAANMSGSATSATLTSDAGFTVGAIFAIVLDDGTQMIRAVGTLPGGNVVTFTPAAPAGPGVIATAGNVVLEGAELHGDNNNQVVFQPVPGNEWTVFTNGVDPLMRYDSTADTVVSVASLSGGTLAADVICKTVSMFRDTLIIGHLKEGAAFKPYKVKWPRPGDPTTWTGGNSGENSLVDSRDAINAMKPVGAQLGIFRTNSIVLMSFQGLTNAFFKFETAVQGEAVGSQGVGAVSPNAVFALPDEVAVLTADGIYLYRGGYSIQPISSNVFNGTFSANGDMKTDALSQSFVHFFDRTNEIFFFYRSTASTAFPDKALVLDLNSRTFRKRKFYEEITAVGNKSSAPTFVAIDDLIGTIDEQSWLLGSDAITSGISTVMLCTVTSKRVMEYNYVATMDDAFNIIWTMTTKDFDGVEKDIILDWIELEMGAALAFIRVSYDRGQTFTLLGTVTNSDLAGRRFHVNQVCQQFRIYVLGTGGAGKINRISFKYKDGSAVL